MTKAGECSARSPHRNWHSLERVRKTRKHVVDVSSAIDLDTSSDQLLEHDAHFEASQVGSEAVVASEAKSEMVIWVTGNIEREGLIEYRFVSIGGRVPDDDPVVFANRLARDPGVSHRSPSEMMDRGGPTNHLFDRGDE